MSENTYTFPKIDVFRTAISSLLAPTGNNEQASFLVHQVPHTSATVLWYRRMFTQFSLHVSASEYTCRPIIANLLYTIIACIERTTVFRADITRVMCKYKAGERVPRYLRFDKLMSASSLEGKLSFFKKPQNSEL